MDQITTGRPVGTEQEMFSLIAKQQSSNMSVKAFCALHDVSEARYYYWRKKYLGSQQAGIPQNENFSLLRIDDTGDSAIAGLFAEVNGIKLYREVPAGYLKALL